MLLGDALIGTKLDHTPNLVASFKNLAIDGAVGGIKLKALGEVTHGVVSADNRTPTISVMVSSEELAQKFCSMVQQLAPNAAMADIATLRSMGAQSQARA